MWEIGLPAADAASCISHSSEDKSERTAITMTAAPALTKMMAAARPTPFEVTLTKTLFP